MIETQAQETLQDPKFEIFADLIKRIYELAEKGPKKILRLDRNQLEDLEKRSEETIMSEFDEGLCLNLVEVDIAKPYPRIAYVWVTVYSSTRHFGGHEEGGWWFDRFHPEESEMIRVRYPSNSEGDGPEVSEEDRRILMTFIEQWLEDYEFGTSYQSSMRPKGVDHFISVSWSEGFEHSNHPGQWC